MLRKPRFAFLFVCLLALVVMLVVQPEFWPRNWLWAWWEPILDSDGEVIGEVPVYPDPTSWGRRAEPLESDQGFGDMTPVVNPSRWSSFPRLFSPRGTQSPRGDRPRC